MLIELKVGFDDNKKFLQRAVKEVGFAQAHTYSLMTLARNLPLLEEKKPDSQRADVGARMAKLKHGTNQFNPQGVVITTPSNNPQLVEIFPQAELSKARDKAGEPMRAAFLWRAGIGLTNHQRAPWVYGILIRTPLETVI